METRTLGRSGLRIPVLSLGTLSYRDENGRGGQAVDPLPFGQSDHKQAEKLVGMCIDAGILLFDTADKYGNGKSEQILGQALRSKRNQVLIATKVGARMESGPNDMGASRSYLIKACEASLKRLGTDHIDLYQMHSFDALTPLEETMSALDQLIRSGKVRYIGASNYTGWQLMKALAISDRSGLARFISHQISYSLLARSVEHELVPLSLDQEVGIIVYSPLAKGLLSGKFPRGVPIAAAARGAPYVEDLGRARVDDINDVVAAISRERNVSTSQIGLSYLLRKPGITSLLIGPSSESQLKDCVAAAALTLTAEEMQRLDEISLIKLTYPMSSQRNSTFRERNPAP